MRDALSLGIAVKAWSAARRRVPSTKERSLFGKLISVDDETDDGYSWTVSEMVDEEVFVERDSDGEEHCGRLLFIDARIDGSDATD